MPSLASDIICPHHHPRMGARTYPRYDSVVRAWLTHPIARSGHLHCIAMGVRPHGRACCSCHVSRVSVCVRSDFTWSRHGTASKTEAVFCVCVCVGTHYLPVSQNTFRCLALLVGTIIGSRLVMHVPKDFTVYRCLTCRASFPLKIKSKNNNVSRLYKSFHSDLPWVERPKGEERKNKRVNISL
jgi:hypothetical protein